MYKSIYKLQELEEVKKIIKYRKSGHGELLESGVTST